MKSTLFASILALALSTSSLGQVSIYLVEKLNYAHYIADDNSYLFFFSTTTTCNQENYINFNFVVKEQTTVVYEATNDCYSVGQGLFISPEESPFGQIKSDWSAQGEPAHWSGTFTLDPGIYAFVDFIGVSCTLYFNCENPTLDSDGDGFIDCADDCPNDPNKTSPGICGCDVADEDSDGDGIADCIDGCPNDILKTEPGNCGCGVPESDVFGDIDCDGDYDIDDIRFGMTTFGIEEAEEDTCPADVNGDGSIGFSDVLIILNDWGACP